jgi:hypothetical protein
MNVFKVELAQRAIVRALTSLAPLTDLATNGDAR